MNTAKFAGKEILKMFPPLQHLLLHNDDGGNDDDEEVLISSRLCWRIISLVSAVLFSLLFSYKNLLTTWGRFALRG